MDPLPRYRAERYRPAGKLAGKIALVTGGDSGIGRAVSLIYAREGADVAIVHLPEEQSDADVIKDEIEQQGRRCLLLAGNLAEEQFCRDVVGRTVRELGGLDILVHNAAHLLSKQDLRELSAKDWDYTFKTNVYSYFYLVQEAIPHLKPGASIIATISEEALKGSATMIDYSAAKAGVLIFTKSIAAHLAKDGVRANLVAPGPTWTPLNIADQGMEMETITSMGSWSMLGRVAQPEELAPAYVFLASDADSSFITGEILGQTGGVVGTR